MYTWIQWCILLYGGEYSTWIIAARPVLAHLHTDLHKEQWNTFLNMQSEIAFINVCEVLVVIDTGTLRFHRRWGNPLRNNSYAIKTKQSKANNRVYITFKELCAWFAMTLLWVFLYIPGALLPIWINFNPSMDNYKMLDKLLIHSQTSTAQPLKFGNG